MIRLIYLCLYLALCPAAFANSLFNIANNKLFIPYINANGLIFSAELQFAPERGLFTLGKVRQRQQDLVPAYGQSLAFTPDGRVFLPRIEVEGEFFQLELSYQESDNAFAISQLQAVTDTQPERGTLLSATLITTYSQAQLKQLINLYLLQTGVSANVPVQNGISVYTLSYQTLDPAGSVTLASALLILPDNTESPHPLVAVQHGTQVLDSAALTTQGYDIPSFGLAATGYVVVAADYLGFGDSAGLHPYNHASSLAQTLVDGLRAAKRAVQDQQVALNGQLFLLGYSEGGYATLALQRTLERHHQQEFPVTASAPLAGAYDLSGTMVQRMLDASAYDNPYYFAYIALTLQQLYGAFNDLTELFAAPYAAQILSYFDGKHNSDAINAFLPRSHQALFSAQVLADLTNPDSWLFAALRSNDLLRWQPLSPTHLYHCVKDDQVPFANSQVAYDSFQALGAQQVELIPVEDSRFDQSNAHSNCAIPIMLMAKSWFDGLLH